MAYVSSTYESFKGKVVADAQGGYVGQCVSYVKGCCSGLPATAKWKKGVQVKGAAHLTKGTAIATFKGDKYSGHAAIYLGQDTSGLQVWDQWVGHPVAPRTIAFRAGKGSVVNDGDQYFVIE